MTVVSRRDVRHIDLASDAVMRGAMVASSAAGRAPLASITVTSGATTWLVNFADRDRAIALLEAAAEALSDLEADLDPKPRVARIDEARARAQEDSTMKDQDTTDLTAKVHDRDPWDEHWQDREIYDEQTADPQPVRADGRSPAVVHAILTGQPHLAAAVHVLDGIDSPLLPRTAVGMDRIDWEPIIDASMGMSSGERLMVGAARDLDRYGTVIPGYHDDLRARLDHQCLTRIADAILIARTGQ